MNFVQKVWRLMAPFHHDFYVILVVTALFETLLMAGPFVFGKILDLLIQSSGLISFQTAALVIGGLAGVRLFTLGVEYIEDQIGVRLLWNIERYIGSTAFSKLLELSLDYHEKENTGTKINIVNKGRDKLVDLLAYYIWDFQPIILQLFISSIAILITSWLIGVVFTASLIPFILITFKIYNSTSKLRTKRHDTYEVSSGEIGDTLANITVVKAFAQEKRENRSFADLWDLITDLNRKEFTKHMLAGYGRNIVIEIFAITLLIIGIFEIKNGALTVGSLVFLITLIEKSYSHVYRLGKIYERAVDAAESVDRISSLMQKVPSIKNAPDAILLPKIEGQIAFKHVTFAYKKRRVLRNLNFTIRAGSFTAFVGKSGSGKSTIAKLLSRYYDPTTGSIVVDGKYDLKNVDLDTYRANTAVVFQDSPVPNRKIWEVISYAAGKKSFIEVKDRVIEAAKLAHADEFIAEFDEGYQTQIGERGVKLSGGQKQRIAIARALFAKPKILIMDEPTSHLDTISESMIQKALEDISKERSLTKIVIAHRLSTVQKADQILVMEKGRLVEHGTHKQLLTKMGVYANIVKQSALGK